MPEINHRVGIAAPRHRVYEMFATTKGLAEFWAPVEGNSKMGGTLNVFFGGPDPVVCFDVIDETPDQRVQWRCVEGPPQWVDTTVTFDLKDDDGETVVLFAHAGFRETDELVAQSSTKWATFLIGLRSGLEGGKFTAFPDDARISKNWR